MGHFFHHFYYECETFEEAVKRFETQQEDDRYEHGHGESMDSVARADRPKYKGKEFSSYDAAHKWLEENTERWDSVAVKIVFNSIESLSEAKKIKIKESVEKAVSKSKAKLQKAADAYHGVEKERMAIEEVIHGESQKLIRDGSSIEGKSLITCYHCKSKINRNFLQSHQAARTCVICNEKAPFANQADIKKLKKIKEKEEVLLTEYKRLKDLYKQEKEEIEASIKAKFGKRTVGWMIGCDVHA